MQNEELKPCPFCGGAADKAKTATVHYMSCTECNADGPFQQNAEDAAAAWNRRAIAGSRATVAAAPTDLQAGLYSGPMPNDIDTARRMIKRLRMRVFQLSAQQAQAAPVPNVPTEEMLNAARDWSVKKYGQGIGNDAAIGCWTAMLAATPAQSPASPQEAKDAAQCDVGLLAALKDIAEACSCCGDRAELSEIAADALLSWMARAETAAMSAPAEPQPSAAGGAQ